MRQTVNAATRKVLAILLGTVAGALFTMNAFAQKTTEQGIQEYRDMLADGNPAELIELRGEDLWKKQQGPKNASLEQCDVGMGPGKLEGAVAQMPRFFSDAGKVMDIETRLVHCMVTLQGRDVAEITKKPFSSAGEKPSELESLVAYIYAESRGATIKVPQSHPEERASRSRGEKIFFYRAGPYDFSCASCHATDDQRIRLQGLPNLTKPEPAQAAFGAWPAYRVSQGAVRSMQWRMYDCFRQQRFPELKYGSQASIDLITYLGVKAEGGTMQATSLKR
ncbi:sulfur oxidation c-type cytochrome SoxA [Limnobacter sp.]|uniref:sulfur oxidation c-type cytochrome SoxA n=1 Tax=Limnobacter sp. TaxID=2003368 RepID=UPI003FA6105A